MHLSDGDVTLRPALTTECEILWNLIYVDPVWEEFDTPYHPHERVALETFRQRGMTHFESGVDALLIEFSGDVGGSVTCYWEDKETRWLELGIVLYADSHWGQKIGRRALSLWVEHLFASKEIERVGLTTWSGNPHMVSCAESVGMIIEGRLRKVRYYQGNYYDSIKMGILRSEWRAT